MNMYCETIVRANDNVWVCLQNCLGVIYTVYVEGNYSCKVEELVGNILGCVMIPPAGTYAML